MRLGIAVLVGAALIAYMSTVAISGSPLGSPYHVRVGLPAAGPIVRSGDEVRIGGERHGQVRAVTLSGRRAVATLEVDGARLGRGATARVRPRGLAGAVYVELTPGDSRRPLASGSSLGTATTGTQLADVVAGFHASARSALRRTVDAYGGGIAGHGEDLNATLAATPRLLADATPEVRAARGRPGTTGDLVRSASVVAAAPAPRDVAALPHAAAGTLGATARRAPELAATLDELPRVEREAGRTLPGAQRLLADAAPAARELAPGVAALPEAVGAVREIERDGGAIEAYGRLASAAEPVVGRYAPLAADARGPAAGLAPLVLPLADLGRKLWPYRQEIVAAPAGFDRWGHFTYDFGQGAGLRAVRFSMVFTCAHARDPYPAPGAAARERSPCR